MNKVSANPAPSEVCDFCSFSPFLEVPFFLAFIFLFFFGKGTDAVPKWGYAPGLEVSRASSGSAPGARIGHTCLPP